MNAFLKIFLLAVTLTILTVCSNEEIFVDRYEDNISFLFQPASDTLKKISISDNSLSEINLQNFSIGKIDAIKKFRWKFYLVASEKKKIFVITENTYEITEIDYSALNLTPIDICFPNATDGYVAHSNDSCVTILDLTNNIISGIRIAVSGNAARIAGVGNQVHITIPDKNLVEIIDTRTNKVENALLVADRPTFVEFLDDGTKSVVVSIGNGKENNSQAEMTFAKVSIIDAIAPKVESAINIGGSNEIAIVPTGIAVSPRFVYISAQNSSSSTVWRIATSNLRNMISMSRNSTSFVGYSRAYNIVYLLEETIRNQHQMTLFNGTTNARMKSIPFTHSPLVIIDE